MYSFVIDFEFKCVVIFQIWSKPAPMEDIPSDVRRDVQDLMSCCLIKDKKIRPSAQDILNHSAFQILGKNLYDFFCYILGGSQT